MLQPSSEARDDNMRFDTIDNRAHVLVRPEAALIMDRQTQAWLQTSPKRDKLYAYDHDGQQFQLASDQYPELSLEANLSKQYKRFLKAMDTPHSRCREIEQRLQVKAKKVCGFAQGNYFGTAGVFAKISLPKYSILGVCAGIILNQGSTERRSKDLRAEIEFLQSIKPDISLSHIESSTFLLPTSHLPSFADESGAEGQLVLLTYHRGNAISRINALCSLHSESTPDEINATLICVRMDSHVPLLVVLTNRNVAAGEEIITNADAAWCKRCFQCSADGRQRIVLRFMAAGSEVRFVNRFIRLADNPIDPWRYVLQATNEVTKAVEILLEENVPVFGINHLTVELTNRNMIATLQQECAVNPADAKLCEEIPQLGNSCDELISFASATQSSSNDISLSHFLNVVHHMLIEAIKAGNLDVLNVIWDNLKADEQRELFRKDDCAILFEAIETANPVIVEWLHEKSVLLNMNHEMVRSRNHVAYRQAVATSNRSIIVAVLNMGRPSAAQDASGLLA